MDFSLFVLKFVGWISQLLFIPLIISLFFFPQYLIPALLSIFLISKVGHAIGQHRYFSHQSFIVKKPISWIIAFLATISTTGSILHYAAIHRTHHRFSDTEKDPHSPKHLGFIKTWFSLLTKDELKNKIPKKIIVDLLRIPEVMFFHKWYWQTISLYILILLIINPILILFLYILPVGYSRLCAGLQSTFSHKYGYRNFNTPDTSINNTFINIITMGEGSHNNHHYNQKSFDFGFTGKLKEFDLGALIIKYCLLGKSKNE